MIVSAAILLLILLPIFLSLLLSLPIVQNRAVDFATQLLSEHIGSEVSIKRIDITMRGYLEFEDLLVRDLQADTLLYVNDLKSRFMGYSHRGNTLKLGHSTISGAKLNLLERESGEMNIREVVLKLSSQKINKQPLIIEVSEIEFEGLDLRIARLEHLNPEYGVDMRNLQIFDMAAHIHNLMVDGPALHAQIESMSGMEQSGFNILDIGGELYLTSGALSIMDMKLDSNWSSLSLEHLTIVDNDWSAYRNFNTTTLLSIGVRDGYISSDDVAYFAPALRDWGVMLYDLNFDFNGAVNSMELNIENASFGEETMLSARLECDNITTPSDAVGKFTLNGLSTIASDIDQIIAATTGSSLNTKNLSILSALGHVVVRGQASGNTSQIEVGLTGESDAGMAATEMLITRSDSTSLHLAGDITIDDAQLDKILSNNDLGITTLHSSIEGYVGAEDRDIAVNGHIDQMKWRDYPLHDIALNSNITLNDIEAEVICRDPKLQFDLTARGSNLMAQSSNYNATLDLKSADLRALNINKRDSLSQLSALIHLTAEGEDIESGSLRIVMKSGEYRYNSQVVESGDAVVVVESHKDDKSLLLTSDFINGSFQSTNSIEHITEYLKGALASYIPSLYNSPHEVRYNMSTMFSEEYRERQRRVAEEAELSNDGLSSLTITAHNLTPLADAISEGLQVGNGTTLMLRFNAPQQLFDMQFSSGYLERKSLLAIGIDLQATNLSDSITFRADAKELFVGTSYMEQVNLRASAKRDNVLLKAGFTNPADSSSASLGAMVHISRNTIGRQDISAKLLPSTIARRGEEWQLGAKSIDFTQRGVDIDHFRMESRDQLLTLDGMASRSLADTMRMSMHNFDLSILSSVIAQLGYNIEGRTNGLLIASSALENARLEAKVALDNVNINTIPAPAMDMSVDWDFKLNRARLFLSDRAKRDTLIRGYYMPSQVRYYAKLNVDSVSMGLLDPPLGGVITNTQGLADLELTLQGQRREANLTGAINVHDLETTVDYTNVRYTIPAATLNIHNNLISGTNTDMFDSKGGRGKLDLSVNLHHLSNISYDLKIIPNGMMVLNTTERDNDLFYGELYASGAATISGDKSGVRMNITASSANNSQFFMPLSNKSSISTADFITFVTPQLADSVNQVIMRRRQFERKAKGESNAGALTINMALDVKPNTELQLVIDPTVGDVIRARGEGRLNLKIEPQSNIFEIYGDYTIDEGSYLFTLQNIVNKRFVIDPGSSIQWTGEPTDALLNIDAIYKLKTSLQPIMSDESSRSVPVDCIIHLGDRLTQPDVSFDIELPSSDPEQQAALANLLNDQETISRQFFYLMLANSFITDNATVSSDFGVTTTAATGFELLTNQLSNWLSTSNYNVIIRYRPESELTGEEVDFGFSKGLINNRLLVELEGNYIIDNKQAVTEDASSFMGEAYITWLIDRAGALKLKGFTQTIDRYDENQGLQETGIGIYYREDFDNFQDLRSRVKARFSANATRKKAREARRKEEEESDDEQNVVDQEELEEQE